MEGVIETEIEQDVRDFGAEIIPPREYDTPPFFDLSRFPEDRREEIDGTIQMFNRFLKAPIVADKYEKNDIRRTKEEDFYKKIEKERGIKEAQKFHAFIKSSKMPRNIIGTLMVRAQMLEVGGIVPNSLTKGLITLIRKEVLSHVSLKDIERLIGELSRDGREDCVKGLKQIIESKQYDDRGAIYGDVQPFIPAVYDPEKGTRYKYSIVDPWDGPTTDRKIAIVGEISKKVADILNFLGKKD